MRLRFTPSSRPSAKREARVRTLIESAVTAAPEGEVSLGFFDQLTPLLELSEFEATEIAAILGGLMLLLERSAPDSLLRRTLDDLSDSVRRRDLLLAIGNKSCLLRDPLASAALVHASADFSVLTREEIAAMQFETDDGIATLNVLPEAYEALLIARVRSFSSDGDSVRWLSAVLSQAAHYSTVRFFSDWLRANKALIKMAESPDSFYARHTAFAENEHYIDQALVVLIAEARVAQTRRDVLAVLSGEATNTLDADCRVQCMEKLGKLLPPATLDSLGLTAANVFEKANALGIRLTATIAKAVPEEIETDEVD